MTTLAHSTATKFRRSRHVTAGRIGLIAARVLLSGQFIVGGVLKLTGDPQMVAMFDDIGAGQWLRLLVGICELAGGIGLLLPRLVRVAAVALAGLLVGAALTNVVALQTSPVVPLVLLALTVLVAATATVKTGVRR